MENKKIKVKPLRLDGMRYDGSLKIGSQINDNDDILNDPNVKIINRVLVSNGLNCSCVKIVKGIMENQFHFQLLDFTTTIKQVNKYKEILLTHLRVDNVKIERSKECAGFVIIIPVIQRPMVHFSNVMKFNPNYPCITHEAPLTLALGIDNNNQPIFLNLEDAPHILIAGQTGSGKSTCMHSIITSLLFSRFPSMLNLILIDPKQVEFTKYANLKYYLNDSTVITKNHEVPNILYNVCAEMDWRYSKFKEKGVNNIIGYNQCFVHPAMETMGRIVVIIDEMADLILSNPKEITTLLVRIAQMGRAAGIHLILSTQRPSREVLPGLLKANIPVKICFRVTTAVNSRVILDTSGAEDLIGNGDGFFDNGRDGMQRFQGCCVADDDIDMIINYINNEMITID
jgi:S-DNA-T family DNA segregation ATPase FtsK/SpoIIIE